MDSLSQFFKVGTPTPDQHGFFERFERFIRDPASSGVFVLRGYAGTGKTSCMSALIPWLATQKFSCELLAPTGRAAKVLQHISGQSAQTIHRRIYRPVVLKTGGVMFRRAPNRRFRTVFIVDEASMISSDERPEDASFGGTHLLRDLLEFVSEGKGCLLLLVGDVAQLPPVGERVSAALSPMRLWERYQYRAVMAELKTVTRQALHSGILENATRLRNQLLEGKLIPELKTHPDVLCLQGSDLEEALFDAFREGDDFAAVITPSNRRANNFNRQIRFSVYGRESELDAGDKLMVVKNNYFWLPTDHPAGFVANGDLVEVMRVTDVEFRCGLRFARVDLRLSDYPDQPLFEALIIMDVLRAEGPALNAADFEKLKKEILREEGLKDDAKGLGTFLRDHPYLNALQVKYAYAITGHKAQGGQWPKVFVDAGYLSDEKLDLSYLRWLYTAVTRASQQLYLVGFPEKFFS
jgi:exodeoxyribonuclease-5